MTVPWWGRERSPRDTVPADAVKGTNVERLALDEADDIESAVLSRRPAYTQDWSVTEYEDHAKDAGEALVTLFGELSSPVWQRFNRLPKNALVTFLNTAGVMPISPRPAAASVQFAVSRAAVKSVALPSGFDVGARDAEGNIVNYETQGVVHVTAAELTELYVQSGSAVLDVLAINESADESFDALGDEPEIGDALLIGLGAEPGSEPPGPKLSIGIQLASRDGIPAPVSEGGVIPSTPPVIPLLRWEAYDGRRFEPMNLIEDGTDGLRQSGVVVVETPANWPAARPDDLVEGDDRRWLRARLVYGAFSEPPRVALVALNMVGVRQVRTISNEVLEQPDRRDREPLERTLRHNPVVVDDNLKIEVQERALGGPGKGAEPVWKKWTRVDSLADLGPNARSYTIEAATGIVRFSADLPAGFRNIRASYETGGGKAGRAGAEEISMLLESASFVTEVTNPLAATGGVDAESNDSAIKHGPQSIRARNRAVTMDDYELMARRVEGADVKRARAIAGFHPGLRGAPVPGVVGVLVVTDEDQTGAPIPSDQSLAAVAAELSKRMAPAGVEVVAASPVFREIRTETVITPEAGADVSKAIREIMTDLDKYLGPLRDDGTGWSFGRTLKYSDLLRRLMAIEGVRAVPLLRVFLDGRAQAKCADIPLRPNELFWPAGHEVFPQEDGS